MALSGPVGWDASFSALDGLLLFQSPDPSFDIGPGSTGQLSYTSLLGPALMPFTVIGIDDAGDVVESSGLVAAAVPEPSSLALAGEGHSASSASARGVAAGVGRTSSPRCWPPWP